MSLWGALKSYFPSALKAAATVDFVRVHGRPPVTSIEFNEHYDKWMRANGKAIERAGKKAMKGIPTSLDSVIDRVVKREKK